MFKENNPVLSDDASEMEMHFKQLYTLTEKLIRNQQEFIERLGVPTQFNKVNKD
jgi:hypothetical protein